MQEHPLVEQGDACPARRLPLQQFEAMDKAFRQHARLSTDKGSDIFSFSKERSDEECSQTGLLLR